MLGRFQSDQNPRSAVQTLSRVRTCTRAHTWNTSLHAELLSASKASPSKARVTRHAKGHKNKDAKTSTVNVGASESVQKYAAPNHVLC
jgi:hypothetical protein